MVVSLIALVATYLVGPAPLRLPAIGHSPRAAVRLQEATNSSDLAISVGDMDR